MRRRCLCTEQARGWPDRGAPQALRSPEPGASAALARSLASAPIARVPRSAGLPRKSVRSRGRAGGVEWRSAELGDDDVCVALSNGDGFGHRSGRWAAGECDRARARRRGRLFGVLCAVPRTTLTAALLAVRLREEALPTHEHADHVARASTMPFRAVASARADCSSSARCRPPRRSPRGATST